MARFFGLTVLLFTLLCPVFLFAHGDGAHVLGTVTFSAADHIVVTTLKGKSVSIALRPDTTFRKNGITTDHARPGIGDRLFAEVTKQGRQKGEEWVAKEIRFGTPHAQ